MQTQTTLWLNCTYHTSSKFYTTFIENIIVPYPKCFEISRCLEIRSSLFIFTHTVKLQSLDNSSLLQGEHHAFVMFVVLLNTRSAVHASANVFCWCKNSFLFKINLYDPVHMTLIHRNRYDNFIGTKHHLHIEKHR